METVKRLIEENQIDRAIEALDAIIKAQPDCEEAYFLRGNMYRRLGNWKLAIENYCEAQTLNPNGAGARAYEAAQQILGFYNTDLYNP